MIIRLQNKIFYSLLLATAFVSQKVGAQSTRDILLALEEMEMEGSIDEEKCFNSVFLADEDDSGEIEFDEYLDFMRRLAPDGFLEGVDSLGDLPFSQTLGLASNFNLLACLCADNITSTCCNANEVIGLSTAGSGPDEIPTERQQRYIFLVCRLTNVSINNYISSFPPTERPTSSSPPTLIPTVSPTPSPSSAPTPSPTIPPTAQASVSPTIAPSSPPTETPSETPTQAPVTSIPTSNPSAGPTSSPTVPPTPSPSAVPSSPPTLRPSQEPTPSPSSTPTIAPTDSPTPAPSVSHAPTFEGQTREPTRTPTGSPTRAPTVSPTSNPTANPTSSPSSSPTQERSVNVEVDIVYQIGVFEGGNEVVPTALYDNDLVQSMDQMTNTVLNSLTFTRRLRTTFLGSSNQHRHLKTAQIPSGTPTYVDIECPDGLESDYQCRNATAIVTLIFEVDEVSDPEEAGEEFETALLASINDGDMQEALDEINSSPQVLILNGQDFTDTTSRVGEGDDGGLEAGGIIGIIAGGAFLALCILGGIFLARRGDDDDDKAPYEDLDPAPRNISLDEEQSTESTPPRKQLSSRSSASGVLGASTPDYGKIVSQMSDDLDFDDKMIDPMGEPNDEHDSSSNAGSSGWSSSAGISSLNTGSADGLGLEDDPTVGIAGGTSLSAIGVASYQRGALDSESSEPSQSSVTRADLDSAIEAGDWAAVGATAAILAAASDSQSYSSRSGALSGTASMSQSGTSFSSLDAARAAELDHLVDAGDWEGVVLAAAKFEAAEGSTSQASQSQSVVSGSERSSESGTMDESATYPSASASGSLGSSPSKAIRRQELRAQVEELVQRVVPEEINNVDEMMLQFRGREEELVETLRTMQERAVAQKARQSSQKAAKAEAKRLVKASRSTPGTEPPPPPPATSSARARAPDSQSEDSTHSSKRSKNEQSHGSSTNSGSFPNVKARSLGTGIVSRRSSRSNTEDREKRQSALERAIEVGDWEAVSEAAAMMSEGSMTSADTDEINRLASGVMSDASSAGTSKGGGTADRAAELDELIDKGDWTGVVAAASRYSATDVADGKMSEEEIEARRNRRMQRMQEEEDALKQAEIWMAIAEQSKQDSDSEAAGASDAADWAIARSLTLLVEQEQNMSGNPSSSIDSRTDDDEDQEEV